jgi:hypothetical protein
MKPSGPVNLTRPDRLFEAWKDLLTPVLLFYRSRPAVA